MSNVALYLNPEAFDTKQPALMGRQAAGEGFLRGYLRYSQAQAYEFWNVANRSIETLEDFVRGIAPITKDVTWISRQDRSALARAGNLYLPSPGLAKEAWARATIKGQNSYGISAVTHTTASANVTDMLADIITAPVEPWDSLICTSTAVRASIELQLEAVRADLEARLGATRFPNPQLVTIPLGVNVDDFATTAELRSSWRATLNIPADAVVVLYVGRFNFHAKMNPIPMAMALENAAKASGKTIAWVQAGWAGNAAEERAYHEETKRFCPSILYRVVDGRKPDTRFSIWSVGDIFLSLSDNIQETFGLTPVEAMAAGIPCVVSDWDGYRDTVRHGVDGFRAATYAPRSGAGNDLAYRHACGWLSYDAYVGAASQLTAVDVGEASEALIRLVDNPDLRRKMGAAAQERARGVFDWSVIIPQYEALWAEMSAKRKAASPASPPRRDLAANPRRLDPFSLFGGYATEWLTGSTVLVLTPGQSWNSIEELLNAQLATYGGFALPNKNELKEVFDLLSQLRQATAADLVASISAARRPFVERGLLWLAKYQVVTILPRSTHIVVTTGTR
ncbi:MAG: glycosyltransferase family 4 protein [Bryobacteraceae bacterium]|nr:glycosyltransferase family 4 protein [Bryobacteraceae bacterium]